MPKSLRSLLAGWDPCDTDAGARLYDLLSDSRTFLARLAPLCFEADTEVAATWMLKRHVDAGGQIPVGQLDRILAGCDGLNEWSARLHLLQCLPFDSLQSGILPALRWVRVPSPPSLPG